MRGSNTGLVWTRPSNQSPRSRPIRRIRKILCIAVLVAAVPAVAVAGASGSNSNDGQQDLLRAKLSQAGRSLIVTIRTAHPVPLGELDRLPTARQAASPYLCLELSRSDRRGGRLLCLGGDDAHRRIGLELVNGAGRTIGKETLRAHLKRPGPNELALALDPAAAGLSPHHYRWQLLERRPGCKQPGCEESLPADGTRIFRLRPVRPVGCTGGTAGELRNGPRDRNVVALTFDDGPGAYTEGFLDVLREKHARGTFFEIGQEVPGRAEIMRRILGEGDEIGNHTTHHDFYPGYWDLAATNALIRSATHFQPCLFRPPGGAVNSSVVSAAAEAGLQTILWDVDPTDWANPGSAAVYSRIVSAAGPGSIILMHDGGGDRSGTLAALPQIIDTLRERGYRFATVTELLGHRMIYRPYG
jgi:peptidoglycan/xylan/chitin deacetylase (PgdA/CDA1 family)